MSGRSLWLAVLLQVLPPLASADPVSAVGDSLPPVGAPSPCIACAGPAQSLSGLFAGEELEQLRAGEPLLQQPEASQASTSGGHVQAASLFPAAPSEVWQTLTDFESWPGFMPHINATEVARRDGAQTWVRQRYSVLLRTLRHTTIYRLDPRGGELHWGLDPDEPADISSSHGRWQLIPVEDGSATLVRYRATMDAGRALPGFVQDLLLRRSLREMLDRLRAEVRRRAETVQPTAK